MPKSCIPCLAPKVKELLSSAPGSDYPSLRPLLAGVADCPDGKLLNLCPAGAGGTRAKRAPSAYNLFIGSCLKAKNIHGFGNAAPAMRECAAAWKRQKGK